MDGTVYNRFQEESVQQYVTYFEKISKFKLFYFRIAPKLMNNFLRNKGLSIFLLTIQQLQEADLVIKANTNFNGSKEQITNTIINLLDYTMLKDEQDDQVDDNLSRYALFFLSLTLNITIYITTLIAAFIYQFKPYRSHQIKILCDMYSTFVKIYNYIFFLPFLAICIQIIYDSTFKEIQLLGYLNALLTIFLGLVINYHDFDYSFVVKDYLSRRESKFDILRQLFISLLVVFNNYLSQSFICYGMIIYAFIKLFIYHQEQLYTYEDISLYYQTLNYIFTSYTFVMLVYDVIEVDIFLLMIALIPLCCKVSYYLQKQYIINIFNNCVGKIDLSHIQMNQLDIYIRQLNKNLNFFFEDYIEKGQAIIFENIFINHQLYCKIGDYRCFCFEFKRDQSVFNLEEFIGQEYRRKFIIFYIVDLYEKFIDKQLKRKKLQSNVMFMYISFLTEIMNISTKSFSELYSYQSKLIKSDSNFHDLYYTQILLTRANRQFDRFFKNAIIQNQRLYIMSMVVFDQQFDIFKKNLKSYLQKIGGFFDYICSNFILLKELEIKSKTLYKENQDILRQIRLLYDLNPESKELNYLTTIYNQVLDFENKKLFDLKKNSKKLPGQNLLPSEKHIKVFVKNSCVVYASLNTIDGKIMKVSKSFQDVYDIDNDIILGKTINSLIPRGLYGAHDDFMKNFRNKGTMNVIMKGERLVFGLNGKGFIVPLMIRLKLENMFGEFGVCSHLSKINIEKDYLFFSNEGNILDISENLFKSVFSSFCSLSDLRSLNINNIIPLIFGIQQLEQFEELFYSILVVKKVKDNVYSNNQAVTSLQAIDSIVSQINSSDTIYNITFKMSLIPTSLGLTFKFVEISSFQRETLKRKKQNSVNQLKECIKVFMDFQNEGAVINHKLLSTKLHFENKINSLHSIQDEQEEDTSSNGSLGKKLTAKQTSNNQLQTTSQKAVKELTFTFDKNDIERILSPITKQVTNLLPMNESQEKKNQNEMGINQSTANETLTQKTYLNGMYDMKQNQSEQDFQNITSRLQQDELLSDGRYANNYKNHFDIISIQKELYTNFSPRDSRRNLITPRSNFDESLPNTSRVKGIDFNDFSKIKYDDQETALHSPLINYPQDADDQFTKDQQNTYKQIIQNQLQSQQKLQVAKLYQKQLSASQITLKNYNEQMKQLQTKDQNEGKTSRYLLKKNTMSSQLIQMSSTNSLDDDNDMQNEEENQDITSMRSSNYSINESKKRIAIKKIKSKQDTKGLKFFIFTGIVSFCLLIMLTGIQHEQRIATLFNYYDNFNALNIFNSSLIDILRGIGSFSFICLCYEDSFYIQENKRSTLITQSKTEYKYVNLDLKDKYLQILNLKYNLKYQNRLYQDSNITVLSNYKQTNVTTPIIYMYTQVISSLNILDIEFEDKINLYQIWDNYYTLFDNVSDLQLDVEVYAQSQFDYIQDLMNTNLFIILGVSIFISSTLIPLSIIIKQQKEKILKLFGSFSPEKMQKYVDLIEYCIYNIETTNSNNQNIFDINRTIQQYNKEYAQSEKQESNVDQGVISQSNSKPHKRSTSHSTSNQNNNRKSNISSQHHFNYIKRLPQKRNRSIASFSSLPKLDGFILISTITIVLILMIFPSINIILTNDFKKECNVIIKERITFLDLQAYLFDQQANHYSFWYFSIFGDKQEKSNKQIVFNFKQINELQKDQDSMMSSIQKVLDNQDVYQFNSQLYKKFYLEILNGNICKVIQPYNQYFDAQINEMDCETISSGILQQGLILAYKNFFQILTQLIQKYGQYYPNNMLQYLDYLKQQQEYNSFVTDFDDFVRILSLTTTALDRFLVDYEHKYFDQLQTNQNIAFFFQIIMIIVIFSVGWQLLYRRLRNDLTKSKNLLSLFHINLIMDNKLFLQFLKQNQFGVSN